MLTWYLLIFAKSRMRSSFSWWCDAAWNAHLQPLSGNARVADHRQRLVGRRPTDRVGVRARVAVGAAARLVHVLDAQLHRRDRRVLAVLLRENLIDGDAGVQVGSLRLLAVRLRQEHGAR